MKELSTARVPRYDLRKSTWFKSSRLRRLSCSAYTRKMLNRHCCSSATCTLRYLQVNRGALLGLWHALEELLGNRARFIGMIIAKKLHINNRKKVGQKIKASECSMIPLNSISVHTCSYYNRPKSCLLNIPQRDLNSYQLYIRCWILSALLTFAVWIVFTAQAHPAFFVRVCWIPFETLR